MINSLAGHISACCDDKKLMEAVIDGFHSIFEGSDYLNNSLTHATKLFNALMAKGDSDWADARKLIKDDGFNRYIVYRFTDLGVPVLNILVEKTRRDVRGIYARTADKNEPLVAFPMISDKLWEEWKTDDYFFTVDDIKIYMKSNKSTAIHEFTHFFDDISGHLDSGLSDTAAARLVPSAKANNAEYQSLSDRMVAEEVKYINKPTEFNARFLGALQATIEIGSIQSFEIFKRSMGNNQQISYAKRLLSPDNQKRYMKWLYQAYEMIKAKSI